MTKTPSQPPAASCIDFGAGPGQVTQRTRLPREALRHRSANCIDGTVLLASLLEGASLNPVLVLVPGHAFVGWQTWDGPEWQDSDDADKFRFLETTLIGSADFEAACRSARRLYDDYASYNPEKMKVHRVADLRARAIWPMK